MRFQTDVAGVIGRQIEKATGQIVLTFFNPDDEVKLWDLFQAGIKPKAAAKEIRPEVFEPVSQES